MENNLDVNFIVQAFQDKVNALILENIVKDATIKQLTNEINLIKELDTTTNPKQKDDFK